MSLIQEVAELIDLYGCGTADDLMPEIEGRTRAQVVKALQNAATLGLIACDGRGPRRKGPRCGRGTTLPATYRSIKREQPRPRIASVWQLGAMA